MSFQHTIEIPPAPKFKRCMIKKCKRKLSTKEKNRNMSICGKCTAAFMKENIPDLILAGFGTVAINRIETNYNYYHK